MRVKAIVGHLMSLHSTTCRLCGVGQCPESEPQFAHLRSEDSEVWVNKRMKWDNPYTALSIVTSTGVSTEQVIAIISFVYYSSESSFIAFLIVWISAQQYQFHIAFFLLFCMVEEVVTIPPIFFFSSL